MLRFIASLLFSAPPFLNSLGIYLKFGEHHFTFSEAGVEFPSQLFRCRHGQFAKKKKRKRGLRVLFSPPFLSFFLFGVEPGLSSAARSGRGLRVSGVFSAWAGLGDVNMAKKRDTGPR